MITLNSDAITAFVPMRLQGWAVTVQVATRGIEPKTGKHISFTGVYREPQSLTRSAVKN